MVASYLFSLLADRFPPSADQHRLARSHPPSPLKTPPPPEMPSSVPSVLSKLLATLIALLAFPLAVGARLVLGPTGVEYVKRFEPSTAADPCFFGCPTYGSAEVAPLSLEGTDLGSTTRCDYTVDGSCVPFCQASSRASKHSS